MKKYILILLVCAGCAKTAVKPKKLMTEEPCKSCVCDRSLCPVGTADVIRKK